VKPNTSNAKPAPSAGLSYPSGRSLEQLLRCACLAFLSLVLACGDSQGTWPRYQLEKQFFKAQQSWSKAQLQVQSGQTIAKDDLAAKALHRMEEFAITSLFILSDDDSRKPIGIIHMHDLLKVGVV